MTQDEKCEKCGKKVRPKQAATITQWLKSSSDCSCDVEIVSPFSSEYEESQQIIRCPECGKDRTPSRDGSLTQWIFKDTKCKCDWNELNIVIDPAAPAGTYRAEPMDEEVKAMLKETEINYHGLSEDAFPFDRYRIVKEVGRGSAGIVFKCWDTLLKKRVAIKTLHGKTWSSEELVRLQNEARASSKLSHPNVVRVLDFGSSKGGQPFLVMEFVNGQTLQQIMKEEGELDQLVALSIFSQVLAGISNAHKHGILHRDVKPGNIIVIDVFSDSPQAKVIDFGIAALTDRESSATASGRTVPAGSPAYMSPEQARSEAFEPPSDIYSLGCVFYETLSGQNPFRGNSVLDSISRHANLDLPPFSETAPDKEIDAELESIVRKMVEKDPKLRYQTADQAQDSIEAVIDRLDSEKGGARVKKRGTGSADDERVFAGDALGPRKRSPDPMIYAIAAAGLMFVLSVTILVMNRAAEDVLPKKPEDVPKAAGPATLDDEVTKPSYIEDILMPNAKYNNDYLKSLKNGAPLPKEVNLRMSDINDEGVEHIQKLPILFLDLSYTGITDQSLEYVSHMPKLAGLYLTGTEVTADGIKHLKNLKTLKFLDLSAVPQNADTMRSIGQIPELERLYFISSPGITASSITELQHSKSLKHLGFRRTVLGDDEVTSITKLKNIETLLLSYCSLDDKDLAQMKSMPNLHMLDVSGNNITDAGLRIIAGYPKLKELYIAQCPKVTRQGIADLQRMNGKCAVRLELGPTMLGQGSL